MQAKLVMRLLAMSTAVAWIRTTGQRTEMRDVGGVQVCTVKSARFLLSTLQSNS